MNSKSQDTKTLYMVAMPVAIVAFVAYMFSGDNMPEVQEEINRNKLKIEQLRMEIDSLETIKFKSKS